MKVLIGNLMWIIPVIWAAYYIYITAVPLVQESLINTLEIIIGGVAVLLWIGVMVYLLGNEE